MIGSNLEYILQGAIDINQFNPNRGKKFISIAHVIGSWKLKPDEETALMKHLGSQVYIFYPVYGNYLL